MNYRLRCCFFDMHRYDLNKVFFHSNNCKYNGLIGLKHCVSFCQVTCILINIWLKMSHNFCLHNLSVRQILILQAKPCQIYKYSQSVLISQSLLINPYVIMLVMYHSSLLITFTYHLLQAHWVSIRYFFECYRPFTSVD